MARKKVYFYAVQFWGYNQDYTYKSYIELEREDFVVVPTQRGNTVAQVQRRVRKPEFNCKLILSKVDLDN